jgi:peroxiredoxin-like protein
MNTSHQYTSTASWTAGRAGIVSADASAELPIAFSAPPEFHGQAGLWTPEHFLVAAVAGCFVTTFIAIAELSKFELESLEVSATGSLEKGKGGFHFTRVTIRPVLTIARDAERERALRLLEKAERSCLVSRSLRSDLVVEATVLVGELVSAT